MHRTVQGLILIAGISTALTLLAHGWRVGGEAQDLPQSLVLLVLFPLNRSVPFTAWRPPGTHDERQHPDVSLRVGDVRARLRDPLLAVPFGGGLMHVNVNQ